MITVAEREAVKKITDHIQEAIESLDTIKRPSAKAVEETVIIDKDMPAREQWDRDPRLANEFDSFEAFEAMIRNSNNFRMVK